MNTTHTQKAQAHIAAAAALSPAMRTMLLDTVPLTLGGNDHKGRAVAGVTRRSTLAALQRRGLVFNHRVETAMGPRYTLTTDGLFMWAAVCHPTQLLGLAANKDALEDLEARSCRDCAEEVGADQIARNGGYCDGCAGNQDAVQRAAQDPVQVETVWCENPEHQDGQGAFTAHLPADTCVYPHGTGLHATLPAVEPETTEEMSDTGPQGRDWPKNDRSSVATVTSILSANRLPGWCNAHPMFTAYPKRAVLVHVPKDRDGAEYVRPLADALPYRNARVEYQPSSSLHSGGMVIIHPLYLEEAPCPNS